MIRKSTTFALATFGLMLIAASGVFAWDDDQIRVAPRVEIRTSGTYLGVILEEEVDHPEGGARITTVVDGSPADDAGLEPGDIIVGFGSRTVRGPGSLRRALSDREPGDDITLRVLRDGREIELSATLADRKAFSRNFGGNWEEYAEKMAAIGQEWGERFGEEFGQRFGGDFEYHFENGHPEGWSEEHSEEFQERMEELRERLADIQIDIPHIDFNGQNGFQFFSCDEDEDCNYEIQRWSRPVLGVQLVETTRELREHLGADADRGVLVSRVVDGSVAEQAGIEVGDLILSVGDEEIRSSAGLRQALRGLAGETVVIRLLRDRRRIDVNAEFPEADNSSSGPRARTLFPAAPVAISAPAVATIASVRRIPAPSPVAPNALALRYQRPSAPTPHGLVTTPSRLAISPRVLTTTPRGLPTAPSSPSATRPSAPAPPSRLQQRRLPRRDEIL